MHAEDGGHVGEGSFGREEARVDPSKVDAGCLDDEASGSKDEEVANNDDQVSVIQYFHDARLLYYAIAEYNTLSN